MKNLLLLSLLSLALACGNSQSPKAGCNLDGRKFKIENYVGDKLDGTEMISFLGGKATNDQCIQYGFGDGAYTCDPDYRFAYTLTSDKEGRMDWKGQVKGNAISGEMVWVKAGQDNIHYTFKGEELK